MSTQEARCSLPTQVTSPSVAAGSMASRSATSVRRSAMRLDRARNTITAIETREVLLEGKAVIYGDECVELALGRVREGRRS